MEGKILFEIPMYYSEKEFSEEKQYNREFPYWIDKYNQIIGYIQVFTDSIDIFFNLYLSDKFSYEGINENYIRFKPTTNLHFKIESEMKNNDIAEKILQYIKMIGSDTFHNKYFIDLNTFINVYKFIDYLSITKKQSN